MSRKDDNIVNCARRLTKKLNDSPYYKLNGEYPKSVQLEIGRMLEHCDNYNRVTAVEVKL